MIIFYAIMAIVLTALVAATFTLTMLENRLLIKPKTFSLIRFAGLLLAIMAGNFVSKLFQALAALN